MIANQLTKLKTITTGIVFVKYLLWCTFFILQGKAIDLAIEQGKFPEQLIYTLAGYVVVKMLVMLCDVLQKFLMEWFKNIELKEQWNHHFPQRIYNDNHHKKSSINVLFFDYFPRIFELEISLLTNNITILCVFTLTTAAFLYTGFFSGVFALTLVFALNYLSKNIFVKKIDNCLKDANYNKINILNWLDQYFASFREISKNWPRIADSSWKNEIYNQYFNTKKNQAVFFCYRDLLSQLLVELPFLLNTSVVILGVYYKYLSLTELFVWVGFSQFMINASNAYLENKVNRKQLVTLTEQTKSILKSFRFSTTLQKSKNENDNFSCSEIIMQDGTINKLSLNPGLYHIKGGNGSGKSTLMNMISGYERGSYDFKNINLSSLIEGVRQDQVRIIDRESIIFESLTDFNNQVRGPATYQDEWEKNVSNSLNHLLCADLAEKWMMIFFSLESECTFRKDRIMSSGEKVILSLIRFFSSWNIGVKLLIIDECDSFLDQEKKQLFIMTVNELARHIAVYISCHDVSLSKLLNNPLLFNKDAIQVEPQSDELTTPQYIQ